MYAIRSYYDADGIDTYTFSIPLSAAAGTTAGTKTIKAGILYNGSTTPDTTINIGIVVLDKVPEIDTSTPDGKPVLKLYDFASIERVAVGKEFLVSFRVKNIGNTQANNIIISPEVSAETFLSTTIKTDEEIAVLSTSDVNIVNLYLKASTQLKTGIYPLKINYTYFDGKNESTTGSQIINVSVENSGKSTAFLLETAGIPEKIGKPSLSTTLNLSLKNTLGVTAKNVRITSYNVCYTKLLRS